MSLWNGDHCRKPQPVNRQNYGAQSQHYYKALPHLRLRQPCRGGGKRMAGARDSGLARPCLYKGWVQRTHSVPKSHGQLQVWWVIGHYALCSTWCSWDILPCLLRYSLMWQHSDGKEVGTCWLGTCCWSTKDQNHCPTRKWSAYEGSRWQRHSCGWLLD